MEEEKQVTVLLLGIDHLRGRYAIEEGALERKDENKTKKESRILCLIWGTLVGIPCRGTRTFGTSATGSNLDNTGGPTYNSAGVFACAGRVCLNPTLSLYTTPHLRFFDSVFSQNPQAFLGVGAEAGLRLYWNGNAPSGPWLLARGALAGLFADVGGQKERALGGYGSVLVGYTRIIRNRWVLSGGAGVQYIHYQVNGLGLEGVLPALHTAFGMAW